MAGQCHRLAVEAWGAVRSDWALDQEVLGRSPGGKVDKDGRGLLKVGSPFLHPPWYPPPPPSCSPSALSFPGPPLAPRPGLQSGLRLHVHQDLVGPHGLHQERGEERVEEGECWRPPLCLAAGPRGDRVLCSPARPWSPGSCMPRWACWWARTSSLSPCGRSWTPCTGPSRYHGVGRRASGLQAERLGPGLIWSGAAVPGGLCAPRVVGRVAIPKVWGACPGLEWDLASALGSRRKRGRAGGHRMTPVFLRPHL